MKRRILVVDDTPLIREHLRVILGIDGDEVETATDGQSLRPRRLAATRLQPDDHGPPNARHVGFGPANGHRPSGEDATGGSSS